MTKKSRKKKTKVVNELGRPLRLIHKNNRIYLLVGKKQIQIKQRKGKNKVKQTLTDIHNQILKNFLAKIKLPKDNVEEPELDTKVANDSNIPIDNSNSKSKGLAYDPAFIASRQLANNGSVQKELEKAVEEVKKKKADLIANPPRLAIQAPDDNQPDAGNRTQILNDREEFVKAILDKLPHKRKIENKSKALTISNLIKRNPLLQGQRFSNKHALLREALHLMDYDTLERLSKTDLASHSNKAKEQELINIILPPTTGTVPDITEMIPAFSPIKDEIKIGVDGRPQTPPGYIEGSDTSDLDIDEQDQAGNQQGEGERPMLGSQDNGLYTEQINNIMSRHKKQGYIGCIASDKVADLAPLVKNHSKVAFVMNLDKQHQEGSHWVAIYISVAKDKSIEYYDSFAEEPSKDFQKQIKKLIDVWRLPYYLKFKVNHVIHQDVNSDLCGYHAIRFLKKRMKGISFAQATGFEIQNKVSEFETSIKSFAKKFGYL